MKVKSLLICTICMFVVFVLSGCEIEQNKNAYIEDTQIRMEKNIKNFDSCGEIIDFYYENRSSFQDNLLFLDVKYDFNGSQKWHNSYSISYKEQTEEGYTNPIISMILNIYDEDLRSMNRNCRPEDGNTSSFQIYFQSYATQSELTDIKYRHYRISNPHNLYEHVIYIYGQEELVAKIYHYSKLSISNEWFENFIEDSLIILKGE